jgi:hypothetical protein
MTDDPFDELMRQYLACLSEMAGAARLGLTPDARSFDRLRDRILNYRATKPLDIHGQLMVLANVMYDHNDRRHGEIVERLGSRLLELIEQSTP